MSNGKAKAVVHIATTIEVEVEGPWGDNATIETVLERGGREGARIIEALVTAGGGKVVGPTKVQAVLTPLKDLMA